ncbi:MAG: hypothetical protein WB562_18235 [Candidatus Sulfotelmatobacter sp.]
MSPQKPAKIPVFTEYGAVEMADAARVRQLRNAPNAEFIIRRKDGRLMRIILHGHGSDYGRRARRGNAQKDIYNAESPDNPPKVWAFKRDCGRSAAGRQP